MVAMESAAKRPEWDAALGVNDLGRARTATAFLISRDCQRLPGRPSLGRSHPRSCHIRRFTAAVTRFIDFAPTDIGCSLRQVVANLVECERLVADVQAVLDAVTPGRTQVPMRPALRCLLRIRPYLTSESTMEGAVITFSELKLA